MKRLWQLIVPVVLGSSLLAQHRTVRIDEDSDWWSWTREVGPSSKEVPPKRRKLPDSSFRVLDLSIESDFDRIQERLGRTTEVERGDAAAGRDQICYASQSRDIYVVFESGEVSSWFYLFKLSRQWDGMQMCSESGSVTNSIGTNNGLKLGLTPEQVKRILGKPNFESSDKLIYMSEFEKKTSAKELERIRREQQEMSPEEFKKAYAYFTVTEYIETRFENSKLVYLAISYSETN